MARSIHVCCGSKDEPHEPTEMRVEKNDIDIFRLADDTLHLTEGVGWAVVAATFGVSRFEDLREHLDRVGGDYYGRGDRMVCAVCGSTIVWRV